MKLFNPLLLLFTIIASCNGQNISSHKEGASEPSSISSGRIKLVKTQGSNEYQTICCGLQDKLGNLWFGTSGEGVYRFDGKLFTQFTVTDGLNCNSVYSILETTDGKIWFGTRDGICFYDGKKITRTPITKNFMTTVTGSNAYYTEQSTKETVWSMMQDKTGMIWFGTGDGVYCYDGKTFHPFLDNPNVINKDTLKLKMVDCMLEDNNGAIWFASGMPPGEEGICRYDGKTLKSFKPKNEGWFRSILKDKNGNLLFATRIHGVLFCDLSIYNLSIASFTDFPQPKDLLDNSLTAILIDKADNIWYASDYGNYIGDTLGGLWFHGQSSEAGEKSFTKITNQEIFFMLEDKDNAIWLGTRGTGLFRYDGKTFTKYSE